MCQNVTCPKVLVRDYEMHRHSVNEQKFLSSVKADDEGSLWVLWSYTEGEYLFLSLVLYGEVYCSFYFR